MNQIFLKVLNMSLSASWLVLAVVILRFVLKRAPKWVNVLLWGLVAVRLLCPFSLESALSLIPSAEPIPEEVITGPSFEVHTGVEPVDGPVNDYLSDHYYEGVTVPADNGADTMTVLAVVWLAGVGAMALYTAVSYLRLKRRMGTAIPLRRGIYQSEQAISPFVLGVIRPKIYLPFRMEEGELEYVIAHEQAHIRRRDHWWKPLGFLLLTVHWFNPAMWLAYVLLCRDIELACDEKVIKTLGREQRADYTQALLSCSVNRRLIAACPLAFGEVGVKERVKSVMHYKKPAFWLVAAAVLVCAGAAVCFLTDPPTGSTVLTEGSYQVEEILYEKTVEGQTPAEPPLFYYVTADRQLYFQQSELSNRHLLGQLTPYDLTVDELEGYMPKSGVRLRPITDAYILRLDDQSQNFYLAFQTRGGDAYLAYGWEDVSERGQAGSDDTRLIWLYKLTASDHQWEENHEAENNGEQLEFYDQIEQYNCLDKNDFILFAAETERGLCYRFFNEAYGVTLDAYPTEGGEHEAVVTATGGTFTFGLPIFPLGYGAVSGVAEFYLSDLTGDDVPELIYIYGSGGTGAWEDRIRVFDTADLEEYLVSWDNEALSAMIDVPNLDGLSVGGHESLNIQNGQLVLTTAISGAASSLGSYMGTLTVPFRLGEKYAMFAPDYDGVTWRMDEEAVAEYLSGADFAKAGIIERMATLSADDLKYPSGCSQVDAGQLAAAINGAAGAAYTAERPEGLRAYYDMTIYLSGGPEGYSGDEEQFQFYAGLMENIVHVRYRSQNGTVEELYFNDEGLYRLIRGSYHTAEWVDGDAYAQYGDILAARAQASVASAVGMRGDAAFTGYDITYLALCDTFVEDGCRYEVCNWAVKFTTDAPDLVGWAGGMYLDAEGRVGAYESDTYLAVRTDAAGQRSYRFLGWDLYDGADEAVEKVKGAFAQPSDAYFQTMLTQGWYNAALGAIYDDPREMDLSLVFYLEGDDGASWNDFTGEERSFLLTQGFSAELDVQRRPAATLDAILRQYFGVKLEQCRIPDSWAYYPDTDCYYSNTNDAYRVQGAVLTAVVDGEDGVELYYEVEPYNGAFHPGTTMPVTAAVLSLGQREDGSYYVLANRPLVD